MNEPRVLFEDNHIIAIDKPAGWLVQGDATGDRPLSDWVKQYIKEKYAKKGAVYLGVLHRLDRPVSGIVLFARTSKAATRLSNMFQNHQVKKIYIAKVQGIPKLEQAHLEHYLLRNEKNNTTKAFLKNVAGAQFAKLEYEIIETQKNSSTLKVILHTGRHHQIRAQLAAIGHPIVGDLKYGYSFPNEDASIFLHASRIEFEHPVTKKKIEITSQPGW